MQRCLPILGLVGLVACGSPAEPSDEERLVARVDRTPGHLAAAARRALAPDAPGSPTRERLRRLRERDDDERARSAAIALWELRGEGQQLVQSGEDRALGPILRPASGDWTGPVDRFALLFALIAVDAHPDPRSRTPVVKNHLVYEADRLEPSQLPEALRPLAWALRASVYSRAGLCTLGERNAESALSALPTMDAVAVATLLEGRDREGSANWVAASVRSLAHGAHACCSVRDASESDAAASFAALLEDAEEMEASALTVAMLSTWEAIARGEYDEARDHLDDVIAHELSTEEQAKFRLLRDRLARSEHQHRRLLDRAWVSLLSARMAMTVIRREGGLERMDAEAQGRILSTARALARTVSTARDIFPGFDQAADRGRFWDRIWSLFGG